MTSAVSVTSTNRVVALVDMDCFYVQVEERDDPSIKGVPAAVVQYKAYKGGGIIAVNYEARARGVNRHIRGDDAKAVCPEIKLVRVPENRGKADLTKYRDAGREVINVLTDFSACVERASIDEAYIDLTEAVELRMAEISSQEMFMSLGENILQSLNKDNLGTNFVLGHDSTDAWLQSLKDSELPTFDDHKLAIGAEIVGKMREAVYERTKFRCSAGIAHNKVLAKLVCGINKPNKQTVLPHNSVASLWSQTKVSKVRGLGGKLGEFVESLGCEYMSDLGKFTEKELSSTLGSKTGAWLYQLSLGYDDEAVTPRQLPKSIGCNKNFSGPEALKSKDKVRFWINQLATEVVERVQRDLEMNNRRAKSLTLHVKFENQNALSRSCGIPQYNAERLVADAYSVIEKLYQVVGVLPINSLGLIASKFEDEIDISGVSKINKFFKTKTISNSTSGKAALKDQKTKIPESSTSMVPSVSTSSLQGSSISKGILSTEISTEHSDAKDETNHEKIINVHDTTAVLEDKINVRLQTPNKINTSNGNDNVRKPNPFFKFLETAPKPLSPNKSPRKPVPTASSLTTQESLPGIDFCEANPALLKECDRCGKKLLEWDFASHMDYHFAKDLSREINGLPKSDVERSAETLRKNAIDADTVEGRSSKLVLKRPRGRGAGSTSSKRGRGAQSNSISSSSSRSIDSYFVPKV